MEGIMKRRSHRACRLVWSTRMLLLIGCFFLYLGIYPVFAIVRESGQWVLGMVISVALFYGTVLIPIASAGVVLVALASYGRPWIFRRVEGQRIRRMRWLVRSARLLTTVGFAAAMTSLVLSVLLSTGYPWDGIVMKLGLPGGLLIGCVSAFCALWSGVWRFGSWMKVLVILHWLALPISIWLGADAVL